MLKVLYQDSLIGKKQENQDAFLVKSFDNGDRLLAVADGMGGGVMGRELAYYAIEMLQELFFKPLEYPQEKLKHAMRSINDELRKLLSIYSVEDHNVEDIQKGGTTLCVAYYREGVVHYVNIGDSRVWVWREGEMINLTLDQNEYERKRLENIYTDEEDKRFIFRILGKDSSLVVDEMLKSEHWSASGSFELNADDILILSSDGFHDYIDEKDDGFSLALFWAESSDYNFDSILDGIEERSNDNITAIIAKEEQ